MNTLKNVLIFGETGSGKSSLVNTLWGKDVAPTSDSAIGCTFEFCSYEMGQYRLYDTVGLSEGSKGTMTPITAIAKLTSLVRSLNEDGVSLLIFVVAKGKIKETLEKNYNLFVNCVCCGEVPVILVLTNCENEKNMDRWWLENNVHFDKYGMQFLDTISGCTSKGVGLEMEEIMTRKRETTKRAVYKSIEANALKTPWKMINWAHWLGVIFKKVWNSVSSWFGGVKVPYWPELKRMFTESGFGEAVAIELSNEIYMGVEATEKPQNSKTTP